MPNIFLRVNIWEIFLYCDLAADRSKAVPHEENAFPLLMFMCVERVVGPMVFTRRWALFCALSSDSGNHFHIYIVKACFIVNLNTLQL